MPSTKFTKQNMKCILPSVNVKLFAKAIHCLAKLGSEIYIEPLDDGLAVKTVNSSRSAYASFLFLPSVFQTYENQPHNSDDDENFKCKVAVKTLLQGWFYLNQRRYIALFPAILTC